MEIYQWHIWRRTWCSGAPRGRFVVRWIHGGGGGGGGLWWIDRVADINMFKSRHFIEV